MKDVRMETGRWYPENEAEKANEAVRVAVEAIITVIGGALITWGLLIGF